MRTRSTTVSRSLKGFDTKPIPVKWTVRHFHISHDAPYLPPISLVTAVKPRRNENQRVCKMWGANKVQYGKCGVLASLRKSKVLSFVVSERVFCTRY